VEESDETLFWLEFLAESEIMDKSRLEDLMQECEEVVKIVNTIRHNKQKNNTSK
jgi:four helix bundle protein